MGRLTEFGGKKTQIQICKEGDSSGNWSLLAPQVLLPCASCQVKEMLTAPWAHSIFLAGICSHTLN